MSQAYSFICHIVIMSSYLANDNISYMIINVIMSYVTGLKFHMIRGEAWVLCCSLLFVELRGAFLKFYYA